MLTKILTIILLVMAAALGWQAYSHSQDLKDADLKVTTATVDKMKAESVTAAATRRAETAERLNLSNAAQVATLTQNLALHQELNSQEAKRAEAIQDKFDQLNNRYQEVLQNDPITRDWHATDVPSTVSSGRLLYQAAAQAGAGAGDPAADGGGTSADASAVPSAGAAGTEKRRPPK